MMTAPLKATGPTVVEVALGDRAYDIVIGRDLIGSLGARVAALRPGARAAIVTDRTVAAHWLAPVEAALAQADADRRDAAMAREQAEADRREATLARQQAEAARAELRAMQDMIDDLQAKQTERGLVVTLGDVLFETDKAVLKPGAMHNLDKLVAALSEHPDTTVAIEGHTDSTGSDSYNMDLSRRRAESVVSYLVGQGIDRSRLSAKGLGEGYPVASNDTSAGRQQNRRVEMIIQNAAG